MYETNFFDTLEAGTLKALSQIHQYLFEDIYEFAGKVRDVNIAKGNFRFAPVIYLKDALQRIEKMPQSTFDEIIEKYVEMNIAHPFSEGNGRKIILKNDLTDKINDREVYMKGIDASYHYEGYNLYETEHLQDES